MSIPAYTVDPLDPRAPAQSIWDVLSEADRKRIIDELPSEIPSLYPPEGDPHRVPTERARDALGGYFNRLRRKVYLSSDLPVYYQGEPMFAPDLIAVLDVENHLRDKWVVSFEKRGLDLALEVLVSGDRRKDMEKNAERFARLGITEYFIFEPRRGSLRGLRLEPGAIKYEPIVPQGGRWASTVLGLDLVIAEGGMLRFYQGTAAVLEAQELIVDLERRIGITLEREEELARELERERMRADRERELARAEQQRAQAEQQRAQAEQQRADRLAAKLKALGIEPDDVT